MIEVSVVIPVFNAEEFVERAVKSALIQDFVREIILVEDGSLDSSLSVCESLAVKYSNVYVLRHPNGDNLGPSCSRNLGWRMANGNWIQFLDSDDELLPTKISNQVSLIMDETILVIGSSINKFNDGRNNIRKPFSEKWIGLMTGKLGITSSNLYKKETLEKVNGFNENFFTSEEYELMFRFLKLDGGVVFDFEPLTVIHQSSDSICRSGKNYDILYRNWMDLRIDIREYLMSNNKFGFIYKFYYSGAVGNFQRIYRRDLDVSVNRKLLYLYDFQINLKKFFYRVFYA